MSVKRVDFLTPIPSPEPARRRNMVSSVTPGDGLEVSIGGGMVTLLREGCDSVMVPLTNVRSIVVDARSQTEAKKGK